MKTHHPDSNLPRLTNALLLMLLLSATLSARAQAVQVNAHDLMTKVYGVIDSAACPDMSPEDCCQFAETLVGLTPEEDNGDLWLETDGGYSINYSGMQPEMATVADFEGQNLARCAYFFIFPYTDSQRDECCRQQAAFCGSLLQEMHDLGAKMNCCDLPGAHFEAYGRYAGRDVDVRLLEETDSDLSGRYILILSVGSDPTSPFLTSLN